MPFTALLPVAAAICTAHPPPPHTCRGGTFCRCRRHLADNAHLPLLVSVPGPLFCGCVAATAPTRACCCRTIFTRRRRRGCAFTRHFLLRAHTRTILPTHTYLLTHLRAACCCCGLLRACPRAPRFGHLPLYTYASAPRACDLRLHTTTLLLPTLYRRASAPYRALCRTGAAHAAWPSQTLFYLPTFLPPCSTTLSCRVPSLLLPCTVCCAFTLLQQHCGMSDGSLRSGILIHYLC